MKMLSAMVAVTSAIVLAACSSAPKATRAVDGLLILNDPYPDSFNASENFAVLVARGRCLVYIVESVGEFQPVFPKGTTRAQLDRKLGDLSKPRRVVTGGFDPYSKAIEGLADTKVAKDCPGRPFISAGFSLAPERSVPVGTTKP
jgi:hypothetical protein